MEKGKVLTGQNVCFRSNTYICDMCFKEFQKALPAGEPYYPVSKPHLLEFPDGRQEWVFCEDCIHKFVRGDFEGVEDPGSIIPIWKMWRGEMDDSN